jgi:peptidoglycan-associated lipoprotein
MLKYSFAFVLFAVLVASGISQPLREATYEMKIIKAEELTIEGDYYNALDMYEECYKESKDPFLISAIAYLNFRLRDYERAEKWYERMVQKPEKYYTKQLDTFYYAQILKTNRKYAESFDMYRQYIAFSENDSLVAVAENELIGMDMASKMKIAKDIFVEPLETDINTSLTEASPVTGKDGYMYYSTFKKKSKIVITGDEDDYHFKIYRAKKGDDGVWSKPDKLTKKINREDYHTGNVSFSADGGTMFFTRSRINGDSILSSKIFYSTFDGDKWSGARELNGVNGNWIARHPAPGALFGDEVIYFSSNMPGSYGGYDIFYCTRKGGDDYSTPVNLGEAINTKGDDVTPFYADGTLYYSSNGAPGLGGLDIFSSTWNGSSWSTPTNMALPHNSTYDDFYFSWNPEEKKGFLVSNRPYPKKRSSKSETCCDDIFEVAEQDIELNTLVTVFDKDKKPLPGAKVILKEFIRGDQNVVDTKQSNKGNTFDFPLKVDKQYRVIIQHDEFNSDSFDIKTVGLIDAKTFEHQFYLTPKEKLPPSDEVKIVTINEPIRLNRIYYDFDDDKILPESEPDLNTLKDLMDQYPTMVIELSSHTDARGNGDYNENLSQRRAESAKRYLTQKGINSSRIQAVGYGESQILNQCTNGESCSEEEHRFNRRTEFKIIAGPTSIEIKKEVITPASGGRRGGFIDNKSNDLNSSAITASLDEKAVPIAAAPVTSTNQLTNAQVSLERDQENAKPIKKKAQMELTGKFHDFGIVYAGEKRTHTIEFKNTGEAALVLERVTGKKCLTLSWPDYPILPGQTGEIAVIYDSTDRKGEDELGIDIINNTDQRVLSARLRAFVQ